MEICFLDAGVFLDKPELLDPLRRIGEVKVFSGMPATPDEVAERAANADIVAFAITQITNEMLDSMPKLKLLQFMGTGVNNFVDMQYAAAKGVKVLNIEGYGSNAVAEFAIAMTMSLARHVAKADRILKDGKWEMEGLCGCEIAGCTVGVVGTGSIGRLAAEKFIGLGANVIANDIFESDYLKEKYHIPYMPLAELFAQADIVTLHMKVTPENQKLINKKYFSLMKKNALLINVARAELVDCEDLYTALTDGTIAGAAMDVFTSEPPDELGYKLAKLDNVVASPHIGFYSEQANDNSITFSVESILKNV